jgi:hypothetical protein
MFVLLPETQPFAIFERNTCGSCKLVKLLFALYYYVG